MTAVACCWSLLHFTYPILTIRRYNIPILARELPLIRGSILGMPPSWRARLGRHPKLYAWLSLSVAMVLVIIITSLGGRPSLVQMLFLAVVGILLAGVTVALIEWEDRTSEDKSGN